MAMTSGAKWFHLLMLEATDDLACMKDALEVRGAALLGANSANFGLIDGLYL